MSVRVAALCLALAGCAPEPPTEPPPPEIFLAFARDFQDFRGWTRVAVGSDALAGHAAGPRFVYANRPPPAAGQPYPIGTLLVKTVEDGSDPARWEVFAMAKRGGAYNTAGAAGWEFFRLAINASGAVVLVSRGIAPSVDGDDYGDGSGAGCNGCHGAARGTDHVLSPALQPGARRP